MSTAAHSMYFPESQFQLGSPLILVMAPELTASFTPTSKVSWKVEAFSLCMFLLLPTLPRGPPWNKGHRPKVRHETSVLEVPAQEQHEHSCCSSSTNAFISLSIHGTQVSHFTGCSRPPGEVGLAPRQYTEWNVAGECSLYWRSLSVGAAA